MWTNHVDVVPGGRDVMMLHDRSVYALKCNNDTSIPVLLFLAENESLAHD